MTAFTRLWTFCSKESPSFWKIEWITFSTERSVTTTTASATDPCAANQAYDLTGDCLVDSSDLQALVDFARGLPEAQLHLLGNKSR